MYGDSLRVVLNQPQEALIEKWRPVLDVELKGEKPLDDITVKLDIAIMCELIENKHHFYAKELVPAIRRNFPSISSDERGDTINKYKESNHATARQECFN